MFIYKQSEEDEEKFLESLFSSIGKNRVVLGPEQILKQLTSNPNLFHFNNLMFFHWYERSTGKNVIKEEILKGLNPSNKYISKRNLEDEIIDRSVDFMGSSKFDGFTIYYEYYYDFFPRIESLTFEDFTGRVFYEYLLELFPSLHEINFKSKKRFFRLKKQPNEESLYVLTYKSQNLPCFYPFISGKRFTYSPKSLMNSEKKRNC